MKECSSVLTLNVLENVLEKSIQVASEGRMLENKCYVEFACILECDLKRQPNCKFYGQEVDSLKCRFLGILGECMSMDANLEVIHEIAHLHTKKATD